MAATLFAVLVGLHFLLIGITAVGLLRTPIWISRVRTGETPDGEAPTLTPEQQATVEELQGFGFKTAWLGLQDSGPRVYTAAFLAHRDGKSFAAVTFRPSAHTGYPVSFYSIDADGRLLATVNRILWWPLPLLPAGVLLDDPYAASLAAHWEAHRQRMAGAVPADTAHVHALAIGLVDQQFERLRQAGLICASGGVWHLRLLPALRAALAWYRVRRKLAAPYVSVATSGECRRGYFVSCYHEMERNMAARSPRQNIKATLLVLSLAVSLMLWGVVFDWRRAVALVAVLVVHEFGHASAMRAFGWKDLSMFFIPFLGAVVTGKPSEVPAWKQAVVLWAGPLPGLLAGVGLLILTGRAPALFGEGAAAWRDVAIIAISVNLFNLLPITPLDGGRLVEIALFSRWPRLRGLFALASVGTFVALAVWIKSPALWAIIALLVIGLRAQWQAARLQSAWQEGLPEGQQLAHLYDVMQQKLRLAVFTRQWALARAVFTHRLMHRPRWWESALTLLLMVAVWVGPGALAFQSLSLGGGSRHDERTAAQRSFDEFYTQFETSDEADETGARFLEPLQQRARALAPDDPRRIDVEVMQAGTLGEPARRQGIERILARGKSGLTWTVDALVRSELSALYLRVRELPAPERLAQLREGVDWAERVAPRALAPTLDARLRVAEAIDESGDTPAARDLLAQIRQRAVHADDCRCALGTVTRAQVWFHLSHGESDQALALLQQAPRTDRAGTDGRADSMDRAWALLLGGRTDEGLAKMREAAYWQPADAGWLVRILQPRTAKPRLVEPLDLAFALRSAGRDAEARELLATQGGRRCMAAPAGIGFHELMAPWQSERDRLLLETVRAACPAGTAPAD